MGTHTPTSSMATAQVFLALCVVGVAVAAPQLTLGLARSATDTGVNEQEVVTNVISALGPSISKAVEDALASINAAKEAAEAEAAAAEEAARLEAEAAAAEEAARLEAIRVAEAAAAEERRQQILLQQQQAAARRQEEMRIAAANAAAAEKAAFEAELAVDLGPSARPVYNYEYKVADEDFQTYMSKEEQRDGDSLTGMYSYVDATGALITVNYNAGLDGYSETRSKEDGFVQMRAIPAWTGPLAGVDDVVDDSASAVVTGGSRLSSSAAAVDQSALIARIIAALEPQINSAVNSALEG